MNHFTKIKLFILHFTLKSLAILILLLMLQDQRAIPASGHPSRSKEQAAPQENPIYKRGYTRIPKDKRRQLLETIEQSQTTIKDAAHQLGVNYSSAKNIVKLFRQYKRVDVMKHCCGGQMTGSAFDVLDQKDKKPGTKLKRFTAKRTRLAIESPRLVPPSPTINLLPHVDLAVKPEARAIEIRPNFDFSIYASQIFSRYFPI